MSSKILDQDGGFVWISKNELQDVIPMLPIPICQLIEIYSRQLCDIETKSFPGYKFIHWYGHFTSGFYSDSARRISISVTKEVGWILPFATFDRNLASHFLYKEKKDHTEYATFDASLDNLIALLEGKAIESLNYLERVSKKDVIEFVQDTASWMDNEKVLTKDAENLILGNREHDIDFIWVRCSRNEPGRGPTHTILIVYPHMIQAVLYELRKVQQWFMSLNVEETRIEQSFNKKFVRFGLDKR